MPTVLQVGPYRLYFFSGEACELPHIHVDRDGASAKSWLEPVALAHARAFGSDELRRIERIVQEHRQFLLEAWHEHFE